MELQKRLHGMTGIRWRLAFRLPLISSQQQRKGDTVMSDFEMFSQFMMVFSLVIAAVTIGYAIGRKK